MISVLIVDDEHLVRKGLRMTIDWRSLGYEVAGEASNGLEALQLVGSLKPDVVITDVRMPLMDGIEFMREIRRQALQTRLVVISGYEDFAYAKGAVDYGADGYILKPVDNSQLVALLDKLAKEIRQDSLLQQLYRERLIGRLASLLNEIRIRKVGQTHALVEEVLRVIESCYMEDLSVKLLADRLHISPYYMMRVFKERQNKTINTYLTEYRVERAKRLLADRRTKVYEVGAMVGFPDPKYFSQVFKKIVAMTPKEYQQMASVLQGGAEP
ncbi:response regulator transcription factor [Cohnella hashimotonis]|uniref:Response regulator n=1 Tax=Cohnella hashimotonis TaxID=2826895 RepID=A0ABT6TQW9_9BACL|nr:response regulator [Cohnella hashimotonis]MDI4649241.1 response regulator [Cohnella hashimotonis]